MCILSADLHRQKIHAHTCYIQDSGLFTRTYYWVDIQVPTRMLFHLTLNVSSYPVKDIYI